MVTQQTSESGLAETVQIIRTILPDSGERTSYTGGAVRDAMQGKGKPHMIPSIAVDLIARRFEDGDTKYNDGKSMSTFDALVEIHHVCSCERGGYKGEEAVAPDGWIGINTLELVMKDHHPRCEAVRRLRFKPTNEPHEVKVHDLYPNWMKGIPLSRYQDAMDRHLRKWAKGDTDEDHLGAIGWNMAAAAWTEDQIRQGLLPPQLDDLPFRTRKRVDS